MSKPQMASEPSMDEILASIRKMISDERPGPSPMPDQMNRTPFGEPAVRSPSVSEFASRGGAGSPARPSTAQPTNFNSLADALKVATGLSEQRRSLQQDIASVLERGPGAGGFDAPARSLASSPAARNGAADDQGATKDGKRELMSFDFGTVVPQRAGDAAGSGAAPKVEKAESKPAATPADEPRIVSMPSRGTNGAGLNGLNGHHPTGLIGSAAPATQPTPPAANGATVAPFPRSKDTPAPSAEQPSTKAEAPASDAAAKSDMSSAHAEALLDAVVDLVQQQPGALSVFTSGASFIGGINNNKKPGEVIAAAVAAAPAAPETADAAGTAAVPQKLDKAAAELLRPMLRQWLADNMPRIVEEALRSELTDQVKDDDKPAKD